MNPAPSKLFSFLKGAIIRIIKKTIKQIQTNLNRKKVRDET
jgi:hypothetical protein